ncbi:MAG: hypothetical protein H7Y15_14125, partial [Pseudonocardia sp.]|nr:hypothetical protein [Pseudonocardia sp.]
RMPVVVFVWDPAAKIWSLRNIGNGPALNVIIAQHDRDGWYNSVRVPP